MSISAQVHNDAGQLYQLQQDTDAHERYYVVLPSDQIDEQGDTLARLLSFAFDTLDARILSIRVIPADAATLLVPAYIAA